MGSQRSGGKSRKLDASSFGRGSVDKNNAGKILNVSLSPNQMLGMRKPPSGPAVPQEAFEGGQLTDVSEEFVEYQLNSQHFS